MVETAGGQSLSARQSTFPAYLNGNAVIPLVAGLIEKGMVLGTVMAFMVTGGVTYIPAAMGVHALVRRDVFFSGLILDLVQNLWPATDSSFG